MKALVTGASGYVGGRLVPRLLELGHDVTVIVRDPNRLNDVPWKNSVRVVVGDLKDRTAVDEAVAGQDLVYYLVHSMSQSRDFAQLERTIAQTVASACEDVGVGRIVYLGGLHPDGELSTHLQSRKEVGDILLASKVPTIVFQGGRDYRLWLGQLRDDSPPHRSASLYASPQMGSKLHPTHRYSRRAALSLEGCRPRALGEPGIRYRWS